jgi:hypothetical protein
MSLSRPDIAGSGDDGEDIVHVQLQPADALRVARIVVNSGPTLHGPWSNWLDAPTSVHGTPRGDGDPGAGLSFAAPPAPACLRVMFFAPNGDYSPWSTARCTSAPPRVLQVRQSWRPMP